MSRMTVAQVATDVAALAEAVASMNATLMTLVPVVESLAQERAKVTAPAPARKKTTPKKPAAKKVAPKPAPKPAPKGAQSVETLSRRDWNRTLTTKARFAGGDAYKRVLDGWAIAQDMRAKGATPDAALEALTAR